MTCSLLFTALLALLLLLFPKSTLQQDIQYNSISIGNSSKSLASTTTFRDIGEPCNRRNDCAEGLTCSRTPSLLGIFTPRRVCFPLDCLMTAALDFDNQVNVTAYQERVFGEAQVTPSEFFMKNKRKDGNAPPVTAYSVAKEMQTSPKVQRVMEAIRRDPISQSHWNAYEDALSACDPQGALSSRSYSILRASGPTEPGILGTVGFGTEAGVALGGSIEFFFAFPNARPVFFIQIGGGLLFGVDAGVSGTIGMVFTGAPEDIPGLGFELGLQIPTPIIGPGLSIGVDIDNVWDLQFVLNGGVGLAVGSFTAGYTWGFPETSNSTFN